MEKEKQLEKIQLEYDLYETNGVLSADRAVKVIFTNLDEADVAKSFIELEKKRNKRRRFISNLLGKHAEKFGYLDPWYYDMDDSFLDRKRAIIDTYYTQLNRFWHEINENNFVEVYKLMDFTRQKNKQYRMLIQEERDCVRKSATGEEFERPVVADEPYVFNEWFLGALKKARYTQSVEKVKK